MSNRKDVHYATWRCAMTGEYEVVRWVEGVPEIVQTHIKTREKARVARKVWQQREETNAEN
jgi:hypothetical protein